MSSTRDILTQLADDARRLRVGRQLPAQGDLTDTQIRQVQQDFREFLEKHPISLAKLAKAMGSGYSPAVLSSFKTYSPGREIYIGDIGRIARGVSAYIETYVRSQEAPRPNGWVETAVARRMLSLIKNTVELRTMGLIYSDAGRGKTMTLKAASTLFTGSVYLRVRRTSRTPNGLARQLASELRLTTHGTGQQIQDKLIDQLQGTGRLILIDEAHQLGIDALELLRDLHDEADNLPIVLAGTFKVHENTMDHQQFYGQFTRRIGLRYDVTEDARGDGRPDGGGTRAPKPLHTVDEIRQLWASDKLRLTDDGAALLARICNMLGMGGLGLGNQLILVASRLAEGKPIDGKLLLAVIRSMHGHSYSAKAFEEPLAKQHQLGVA